MQHAWQAASAVGREDVARVIRQAEDDIERHLNHHLVPTWDVQEDAMVSPAGIMEDFNLTHRTYKGTNLTVRARWGHFVSGGVEAKTLLFANAIVTYTDNDLDNYEETATIVITTSGITNLDEAAVYFAGENGADVWEIRPLRTVTLSGTTLTITCFKHQLVDPNKWEALSAISIDGDDNKNFVSSVDVYRHFNDPQTQALLIWHPLQNECACGTTSCPGCSLSSQTGCLRSEVPKLGVLAFEPATWDAVDEEFDAVGLALTRSPDRVRASYYSGFRDLTKARPTLQMASELEYAVLYYSLALLDRPICGCNNIEDTVRRWAEDLALNWSNPSGSATWALGPGLRDNPFGTRRGAIYAWQRINQNNMGVGRAVRI